MSQDRRPPKLAFTSRSGCDKGFNHSKPKSTGTFTQLLFSKVPGISTVLVHENCDMQSLGVVGSEAGFHRTDPTCFVEQWLPNKWNV